MNVPYLSRIMACLPGESPVELVRFHRKMAYSDWRSHVADLAPEWTFWAEYTMDECHCISPRVNFARQTALEKQAMARQNRKGLYA